MPKIINNNALLKEIRRIVKDELKKEFPQEQLSALWKYLNQLDEKIKILEKK